MTIQDMIDYMLANDPSKLELQQITLYQSEIAETGSSTRGSRIEFLYNRRVNS